MPFLILRKSSCYPQVSFFYTSSVTIVMANKSMWLSVPWGACKEIPSGAAILFLAEISSAMVLTFPKAIFFIRKYYRGGMIGCFLVGIGEVFLEWFLFYYFFIN
jgi:hypothetical protein